MKIAQSMGEGAGAIDVLGEMRTIQRRVKHANLMERDPAKQVTLHAADTIHLNELGQIAMGYAIIKGLGRARRGFVRDDRRRGRQASESIRLRRLQPHRHAQRHRVRPVRRRLTPELRPLRRAPLPLHPIPETLNRYMLCVKNLDPGKYDLKVDDRAVGAFTSEQLSQGVNLSSATADPWIPGGPWEAQAWLVNMLARSRWEAAQTTKFYDDYLKHNPNRDELSQQTADVNEKIETLARKMAQPVKYHFVIRPAASKEPSK
jgi:hypothetical protein